MQRIGAYINLGAYYIAGIPVAVVLGFLLHLRGMGLWIGMMTGSSVQALLFILITSFINWPKQVHSVMLSHFVKVPLLLSYFNTN